MTQVTLDAASFTYPGAAADGDAGRVAISLRVESAEHFVLLGPSGCGKSTALRLVAGLLKPATGDILFDGTTVMGVRPENRGAVMVFQEHALFPFRTVRDNVAYGLKVRKLAKAKRTERAAAALEAVQLNGFGDRYPDELSGGERQRVALARAIVVEPRVLLLDEPLSSLDRELRAEVRETICAVQRSAAITTIMVTHDQDEARLVADRLGVMIDGEIRQVGTPDQVFVAPSDSNVARFLGTS